MSIWQTILHAIFPPSDPNWAWRRRMAFGGCVVFLAGCANSIWFDHDLAHATMIMTNCGTFFAATLATYGGLAVADDHFKRKTEQTTT